MEDKYLKSQLRELVAYEVLVVDRDVNVQKGLVQLLAPEGLAVTAVDTHERAIELMRNKFFGVVLVALDTPVTDGGVQLVKKINEISPATEVLVLSTRRSFEAAVTAYRAGADDVVVKAPDQVDYLKARIVKAAGEVNTRDRTGSLLIDMGAVMEDFLKKLMEAERRADGLEDRLAGRDPERSDVETDMRILVVDSDQRLYDALAAPQAAPGFHFVHCATGGEAFDKITSSAFHIVLVDPQVPDLPVSMVISGVKAQAPDLIVIQYKPNDKLEIVQSSGRLVLADKFTDMKMLTGRLGEIAEAHRAKGRERRYLRTFRERHYDFLRRLSELRKRLEAAKR